MEQMQLSIDVITNNASDITSRESSDVVINISHIIADSARSPLQVSILALHTCSPLSILALYSSSPL